MSSNDGPYTLYAQWSDDGSMLRKWQSVIFSRDKKAMELTEVLEALNAQHAQIEELRESLRQAHGCLISYLNRLLDAESEEALDALYGPNHTADSVTATIKQVYAVLLRTKEPTE